MDSSWGFRHKAWRIRQVVWRTIPSTGSNDNVEQIPMKAKEDARVRVQTLRRQGLSYRDILQQVPVSKSSVSLWCRTIELDGTKHQALQQRKLTAARNGLAIIARLRQSGQLARRPPFRSPVDTRELEEIKRLYRDEQLSFHEVAARMGIGPWRVYRLMCEHGIQRRHGSEQNYATYKYKDKFFPKQALTPEEERLRVAGVMLYMAEGAKTTHLVDFTNSDPALVKVFVRFLRRICGVAESRLRVALYAYADQDIEALTKFWALTTHIPMSQFTKPYVRDLTPNVRKRKMSWGLAHIRYADKRLLELLKQWGQEIGRDLSG